MTDFAQLAQLINRPWTAYFQDSAIVAQLLNHPPVATWLLSFVEPHHIYQLNITKSKIVKVALPAMYGTGFVQRRAGLQQHGYGWEVWQRDEGLLTCTATSRARCLRGERDRDRRGIKSQSPDSMTNLIGIGNPHPSTSRWLERHPKDLREVSQLSETCTVAIHGAEPGYPYKMLVPHLGIEQVLNRPIADLIGQPVNVVDSVISEARMWAIERAIRTGLPAYAHYEFIWDSQWTWMKRDWRKIVRAEPLPGCDEVLVTTLSPHSDRADDQKLWERFLFEVA